MYVWCSRVQKATKKIISAEKFIGHNATQNAQLCRYCNGSIEVCAVNLPPMLGVLGPLAPNCCADQNGQSSVERRKGNYPENDFVKIPKNAIAGTRVTKTLSKISLGPERWHRSDNFQMSRVWKLNPIFRPDWAYEDPEVLELRSGVPSHRCKIFWIVFGKQCENFYLNSRLSSCTHFVCILGLWIHERDWGQCVQPFNSCYVTTFCDEHTDKHTRTEI